jgi:NADH-quinone oxidoreductase subunit H
MILISALTSVMFVGGWESFFAGPWFAALDGTLLALLRQPSLGWLALKMAAFLFCFLWLRATFPRYRYDQIMRLGWKVFIPVTLVWIMAEGVMVVARVGPWSS